MHASIISPFATPLKLAVLSWALSVECIKGGQVDPKNDACRRTPETIVVGDKQRYVP